MIITLKEADSSEIDILYQLDSLSDKEHHWRQSFFGKNPTKIALVEGKIVGFVVYQITDVVEILRLSTHPDFYQQGVASTLIEALKKMHLPIFLEFRVSNQPASDLYQKCGFSLVDTRKKYYSNGESAKIMRFLSTNLL
jgi:ribosomal-protein-alanine N-acetyltransferase